MEVDVTIKDSNFVKNGKPLTLIQVPITLLIGDQRKIAELKKLKVIFQTYKLPA